MLEIKTDRKYFQKSIVNSKIRQNDMKFFIMLLRYLFLGIGTYFFCFGFQPTNTADYLKFSKPAEIPKDLKNIR